MLIICVLDLAVTKRGSSIDLAVLSGFALCVRGCHWRIRTWRENRFHHRDVLVFISRSNLIVALDVIFIYYDYSGTSFTPRYATLLLLKFERLL